MENLISRKNEKYEYIDGSACDGENALDCSGIWVKKIGDHKYSVVTVFNVSHFKGEGYNSNGIGGWSLNHMCVDTTQDWIDVEWVKNMQCTPVDREDVLAVDIYWQYGEHGNKDVRLEEEIKIVGTRKEANQYLNNFGIEV